MARNVVPAFAANANGLISNFASTSTSSSTKLFTAPRGSRRRDVNRLRTVRAAPRPVHVALMRIGIHLRQPADENGNGNGNRGVDAEPADQKTEQHRGRPFVPGPGLLIRVVLASLGVLIGGTTTQLLRQSSPLLPPAIADTQVIQSGPHEPVPMKALGIKTSDYLGERELRLRKTTQYSEAEEEIMELEEWEVSTKWFRDLQALWAALASVAGIVVLYRGGVLWEKWINEQERKDMEEEISMTGTYISPRAIRKDEDGNDDGKNGKDKKDDGKPPVVGDSPPGGIDGLNRLLK